MQLSSLLKIFATLTLMGASALAQGPVEPGRHPFQTTVPCSITGGTIFQCNAAYKVPQGENLVIEYVQIQWVGEQNAKPLFVVLKTTAGGVRANYDFAPGIDIQTNVAGQGDQVRSETVHISADAGSTINVRGAQDGLTGESFYTVVLSGYTVSVP